MNQEEYYNGEYIAYGNGLCFNYEEDHCPSFEDESIEVAETQKECNEEPIVPYVAPIAPWSSASAIKVSLKDVMENTKISERNEELKKREEEKPQTKSHPKPVGKNTITRYRSCNKGKDCKKRECNFAHSLSELTVRYCNFDKNCRKKGCLFKHSSESLEKFAERTGCGNLVS